MNPTSACGCCEGIAIAVPQNTDNRPGLPTLAYRVGTHATFLETMIARLSSRDFPALAALKTRDPADPSIALLDCWALVADVLTFYQERIANEGYLRTATERRSVLELANLIGYKLRPGVAATVYLAYTLDEDRSKTPPAPTETTIPAGSRSQSVPGPGQKPQPFETSDDLDARSEWNTLAPRLTQPQLFTLNSDFGTDATTRDAVYFSGTSTNLKPGDPLLFVIGQNTDPAQPQQVLRQVQSVEAQGDQNRTEVILQTPAVPASTQSADSMVVNAVNPYVSDATTLFSGSSLAGQAAAFLSNPPPNTPPGLLENLAASTDKSGSAAAQLVQQTGLRITGLHDLAAKRNFTRLEPWLAQLLEIFQDLVPQLQALDQISSATPGNAGSSAMDLALARQSQPALANLTALLPSLALPPSLQPPNSLRLARSVARTYSGQSDMAPRLLAAFAPSAAPMLYQAWANLDRPAVPAEVGAVRIKAGLFPGAYPGAPTATTASGVTTTSFESPPAIDPDWQGLNPANPPPPPNRSRFLPLGTIALDAVYDKILSGSWVVIDRPDFTFNDGAASAQMAGRKQTFHKVLGVAAASMTTSDSGFSAKVTQLQIDPPWLNELGAEDQQYFTQQKGVLSGTVVYAQTEILSLAEEPIDVDIEGDTIELDGVYDGLESGRWIIVSGERTDIPNVTGVTASELVMILGVAQDTSSASTRAGAVHTILTLANALAYTYDIETVAIYGNVVKATHGETRNEVLGNGDGSQSFQKFTLKQSPLTFVPASNPSGVDSTLEVYVNNIEWQETATLAVLGAKDRDYITQTADDGTTTVAFGNGSEGARLPTGTGNVTAIYRNGIGQPGNADAGQISLLQTRPLNVKAVVNPLPATGGAAPDNRDQARRNAPLAVMALDRLVSVQDYADFARTFAGIDKASSARLSDGQRDLVHVTVAGVEDIPIAATSDLYMNLVQALRINGDPYLPLQVAVRSLRLLVISAQVKILPDYLWEPVVADLRSALTSAFGFDSRNLGQPVFQSEVVAVMQGVAGVAYLDLQILDSVAEGATAAQLADLANSLGLKTCVPASLARPNPHPVNAPADSILAAELVYLTPAIPDTLILNEVTS